MSANSTPSGRVMMATSAERKVRAFAMAKGYAVADAGQTDIRFRTPMLPLSDYEIVAQYNAELRGIANYYALAPKYYLNRLEWMAHTSLYKTLVLCRPCHVDLHRGTLPDHRFAV